MSELSDSILHANSSDRVELLRQAWETGVLEWKLREHQFPLYSFICEYHGLKQFCKCARRFGKTFTVILYLNEMARKHPGIRMRYAAPTEKSLRSYVRPNMRVILSDCPADLKPRWIPQESMYLFPNESELWLAGTDKEHAEKLRGPGTDIGFIDEAGSMNNLKYVLNDILLPSTMDNDGRIIVISSPAKTPGHDFTFLCNEAAAEGTLLVQDVWKNKWLLERPDKLREYIEASGGIESSTWKREYECQDVVDDVIAVIPEMSDKALRDKIITDHPRPKYFNSIVAMDPGFSPSHTGILFGYIDFSKSLLVIEQEIDMLRMRTDVMAEKIARMETELAYEKHGKMNRWSDIDPRLLQDLGAMHGLNFAATSKDNLEAMVNHVRILLNQQRILIHPRCKGLIAQLQSVIWNEGKTGFDFSTAFGHYDLVSALIYMARNADWKGNPFPIIGDDITVYTHFIPPAVFREKRGNEGWIATAFKVANSARVKVLGRR